MIVTPVPLTDDVPTTSVISVSFARTVVSAAIDCSITRPALPEGASSYLTVTLRPRAISSALASLRLRPTTLGTAILPSLSIA